MSTKNQIKKELEIIGKDCKPFIPINCELANKLSPNLAYLLMILINEAEKAPEEKSFSLLLKKLKTKVPYIKHTNTLRLCIDSLNQIGCISTKSLGHKQGYEFKLHKGAIKRLLNSKEEPTLTDTNKQATKPETVSSPKIGFDIKNSQQQDPRKPLYESDDEMEKLKRQMVERFAKAEARNTQDRAKK